MSKGMKVLTAILGVLLIISGIVLIFRPFGTIQVMGILISVGLIVGGISAIANALNGVNTAMNILLGILTIIAGGTVLFGSYPILGNVLMVEVVVNIMAVLLLVLSITRIVVAVQNKNAGYPIALPIVMAIICIIVALTLLFCPLVGLTTAAFIFAFGIIAQGITLFSSAFATAK